MRRLIAPTLALLLLLGIPGVARADSEKTIASGEGSTREAALTSALRHAVEQVIGMSVSSSSYLQNLKQLQDKIFTTTSGYIEGYDIVDEMRVGGGIQITVSARVAKKKLEAAVAPVVGSAQSFDGRIAMANLRVECTNEIALERELKSVLDELHRGGFEVSFTPRIEPDDYDKSKVQVRCNVNTAEYSQDWWKRFNAVWKKVLVSPSRYRIVNHAISYVGRYTYGNKIHADFLDSTGKVMVSVSDGGGDTKVLENLGNYLYYYKSLVKYPPNVDSWDFTPHCFMVDKNIIEKTERIYLYLPPFNGWPVSLDN